MSPPVCLGDLSICLMLEGQKPHVGGKVLDGDDSVLICGKAVAVEGAGCDCKASSKAKLQAGHPTILIGGKPAAGLFTDHGGVVVPSVTSVIFG